MLHVSYIYKLLLKSFVFTTAAPIINVVTSSKEESAAGQDYRLTCNVSGAENIIPIITYQWTKENGTQTLVETNSSTLFFSPLKLSDAGLFTCNIGVSSPYLDVEIRGSNTTKVKIQGESILLY